MKTEARCLFDTSWQLPHTNRPCERCHFGPCKNALADIKEENKTDLKELQRLIDASARAHRESHLADAALLERCREIYGCEPGDVDADEIIDGVLGGCGLAKGMSAAEFDRIMRDCCRT